MPVTDNVNIMSVFQRTKTVWHFEKSKMNIKVVILRPSVTEISKKGSRSVAGRRGNQMLNNLRWLTWITGSGRQVNGEETWQKKNLYTLWLKNTNGVLGEYRSIFLVKQHSIQRLNLVCVSEAPQRIVLQPKECEIPRRQENEQFSSVFFLVLFEYFILHESCGSKPFCYFNDENLFRHWRKASFFQMLADKGIHLCSLMSFSIICLSFADREPHIRHWQLS